MMTLTVKKNDMGKVIDMCTGKSRKQAVVSHLDDIKDRVPSLKNADTMIVLYYSEDGYPRYSCSEGIRITDFVFLLEAAKACIFGPDYEEE